MIAYVAVVHGSGYVPVVGVFSAPDPAVAWASRNLKAVAAEGATLRQVRVNERDRIWAGWSVPGEDMAWVDQSEVDDDRDAVPVPP